MKVWVVENDKYQIIAIFSLEESAKAYAAIVGGIVVDYEVIK